MKKGTAKCWRCSRFQETVPESALVEIAVWECSLPGGECQFNQVPVPADFRWPGWVPGRKEVIQTIDDDGRVAEVEDDQRPRE